MGKLYKNSPPIQLSWMLKVATVAKMYFFFCSDCKHVYFCCKFGDFNMVVYGDWLTFGASLKWLSEKPHVLALLRWLHFQPQGAPWS